MSGRENENIIIIIKNDGVVVVDCYKSLSTVTMRYSSQINSKYLYYNELDSSYQHYSRQHYSSPR